MRLPLLACLAGTTAFLCCTTWELAPDVVPRDLPRFPASAELDYEPLPCMAHAALPLFDAATRTFQGPGRIWLKGSSGYRTARIGIAGSAIALDPPYYTAVAEAPAGTASVEFTATDGSVRTVAVTVSSAEQLNTSGENFSALFFGDMQPFGIHDGKVFVNPGDGTFRPGLKPRGTAPLETLRKVFRAAVEGQAGKFPAPAFVCGHGDQIYVEGSYDSYEELGQRHPMSAWTIEAQPRPRVAPAALPQFLDTCYRGHWSFKTLHGALQRCPSVMIWDDHDIRDGWGSQGDEHVYRDSHFSVFRTAFLAHQFARGPRALTPELASVTAPLWQSFAVHGVPHFVLDLRTNRDVAVPSVIGEEQWTALHAWFAALDPQRAKHYVLVSSVPVFYRVAERANLAAAFTDEVRDDLLDTWTSKPNEPEWQRLVEEIALAADRGLRGIVVSGDYHLSSLCRVTAGRAGEKPRVVAYEMIASGFAAEEYGGWKQKMAREGWFLDTPIDAAGTQLRCEFGITESLPNFGGLEFSGGEVLASIFQMAAAGCVQYRVPLQWEGTLDSLPAAVEKSRSPVATPPSRD